MPQTFPSRPVPYHRGGPQIGFGLSRPTTAENTARSVMHPGPWAVDATTGRIHQGALGVLMDDVTAFAVHTARTENQWAVSSSLDVDFHHPLPAAVQRFDCTAAVEHRSSGWGHSLGRVSTDSGELVATVGQTMRFFTTTDPVPETPADQEDPPSWLGSLDALLHVTAHHGEEAELAVTTDPGMLNRQGMIHGGVSLCLSELAVRAAWDAAPDRDGEPFHTASLRMSFLRPASADHAPMLRVRFLHTSRSVVLAEVTLRNHDGALATHGVGTLHRAATEL